MKFGSCARESESILYRLLSFILLTHTHMAKEKPFFFSVPLFPFRATTRQNQHFCCPPVPLQDRTNISVAPQCHYKTEPTFMLPFNATTRLNQHFCCNSVPLQDRTNISVALQCHYKTEPTFLLSFSATTGPNQHFCLLNIV